MALPAKVTTGDGILQELYAVSAEYQATLSRLAANGTSEESIGQSHFIGAMQMYLDSMSEIINDERYSDQVLRTCLINLATLAIRYARKLRST